MLLKHLMKLTDLSVVLFLTWIVRQVDNDT
jgi:hypothetical protein